MSSSPNTTRPILCVGLICLDINTFVRGYPAEDSDNRSAGQSWSLGGNAANTCTVLTQLERAGGVGKICAPVLLGVLAGDFTLQIVQTELQSCRIPFDHLPIRSGQKLPISTAFVNIENGSRTIAHTPNDMKELACEEFVEFWTSRAVVGEDFGIVHFEGRNIDETKKMIKFLTEEAIVNAAKCPPSISVELEKAKPRMEELISGADIVFVSKTFAASRGYGDMRSAVCGMLKEYCEGSHKRKLLVVCAWAEEGACGGYYNFEKMDRFEIFTEPSYPPAGGVVDTLGAGDTFIAGFLYSYNRGANVSQCLKFGCQLAGGKCGVAGLKNLGDIIHDIKGLN